MIACVFFLTERRRLFIAEMIALLCILLFSYAAVSKLYDFEKFKSQIGQSPLLTAYSDIIAWGIPLSEILIALLFFHNAFRLSMLYISYGMMMMFSAYIVAITRFADFVPCSCGGILENMTWDQHLFFNLLFTGLIATGILLYPLRKK